MAKAPGVIEVLAIHLVQAEMGVELWALGEVEYFLGKRWDETATAGSGRGCASTHGQGEKGVRRGH